MLDDFVNMKDLSVSALEGVLNYIMSRSIYPFNLVKWELKYVFMVLYRCTAHPRQAFTFPQVTSALPILSGVSLPTCYICDAHPQLGFPSHRLQV